jgi:hypothetical protein
MDPVCKYGVALDVHCCGCYSGFLFDSQDCTCMGTKPPKKEERMPRTRKVKPDFPEQMYVQRDRNAGPDEDVFLAAEDADEAFSGELVAEYALVTVYQKKVTHELLPK